MVWCRVALAVILALAIAAAACGGSDDDPAAETAPTDASAGDAPTTAQTAPATPRETPAADGDDGGLTDLVAYLRGKTMDLWDAYNTHDPNALKAFYAPTYWAEEEESIHSNMEPFRLSGEIITAEETSPPTEIEPGKWEVRHAATFSFGSLNMVFIYEDFGGEWLLTYAEAE